MSGESFLNGRVTMLLGDVRAILKTLPDDHFDCVVTSPPYWGLRDYGTGRWEGGDPACDHRSPTMREGRNEERVHLAGSSATNSAQLLLAHRSACGKCGAVKVDHQIGLEPTLAEHIAVMVEVFEEVRRVLKPTGTLWLNYGDCYATSPNGRSAADTKAAGNDDRTFRDKPFSTVGTIGGKRITAGEVRTDVDVGGWGARDDSLRWRGGGILKAKDLCMIPNRLAIALQEAGWYVRSEIIWHKPNPMPESIKDRPGTSHEKVWLLSKCERYFYDADAVKEESVKGFAGSSFTTGKTAVNQLGRAGSADRVDDGTRNLRNVWTIGTAAFSDAHFATFPPDLAERCIKAGSSEAGACGCCGAPWKRQTETTYENPGNRTTNGPRSTENRTFTAGFAVRLEKKVKTLGFAPTCDCPDPTPIPSRILDVFGGAGTTGLVSAQLGRTATLIELNPEYAILARARIEAAFMGKEEGSRHMVKKLGKDREPFAPGSLFAAIQNEAAE